MPAGTITLTNDSTAVTGSGTSFTTELKANDFIVAIVGGRTYTLGIQSVDSDGGVTLIIAYNGPTASGIAWTAVPNAALVGITAQVAADVAKAIRGLNIDKSNWQKIYSDTPSVTVELPDSTNFTGPSWGYMASQYASKANQDDVLLKADNLNSVADKVKSRKNLGLGDAATKSVGKTSGTVCAGDDLRLSTIDGKSSGKVAGTSIELFADYTTSGDIYGPRFKSTYTNSPTNSGASFSLWSELIKGAYLQGTLALESNWGVSKTWYFRENGNAYANAGNWISQGSDIRVKENFSEIDSPREKLRAIRAGTWNYMYEGSGGKFGIGLIANDIAKIYPDAVYDTGERKLQDGTSVKDVLSVEAGDSGVSVALHHSNLLLLSDEMEQSQEQLKKIYETISELQKRMKAIDGLDA